MGDFNDTSFDCSNWSPDIAQQFLERGDAREQAFLVHPVVKDKAKLPTPAIKEAFRVVRGAIVHYEPGSCFIADSRFGKTFGVDLLRQTLPQSFPSLPIYSASAKGHDRPSESSLFTDLLLDCGHGAPNNGTAMVRRQRLLNMWIATAQATNSDRLVLFVDEAQNWEEEDYSYLRDFSNELASHDVRLITLLFGHPSLLVIRSSLIGHKRTDLIGRFMLRPVSFRGVSSLVDLIEIARCYDDPRISEFPGGSGISYSRFFRPSAFREGWRLEQEAGRCWATFSSISANHSGHFQLGMQWISSSIREFLYSHWRVEHGEPAGDSHLWEEAVAGSGFDSSLSVIQDRNPTT